MDLGVWLVDLLGLELVLVEISCCRLLDLLMVVIFVGLWGLGRAVAVCGVLLDLVLLGVRFILSVLCIFLGWDVIYFDIVVIGYFKGLLFLVIFGFLIRLWLFWGCFSVFVRTKIFFVFSN